MRFLLGFWVLLQVGTIIPLAAQVREIGESADRLDSMVYEVKTLEDGSVLHRRKVLRVESFPDEEVDLRPQGALRIRRGKPSVFTYSGFQAGDSIQISAIASDGKEIKQVLLCQGSEQVSSSIKSPEFLYAGRLEKDGDLSLYLKGKWPALKKKYVDLEVMRYRPLPTDTFYEVYDTLIKEKFTVRNIVIDTVLLGLLDEKTSVSPLLEIESIPYVGTKVLIPAVLDSNTVLAKVVWWVGLNYPTIQEFNRLESQIPPEWSAPGISPLLGAFALGHLEKLPTDYGRDIGLVATNEKGLRRYLAGVSLSDKMRFGLWKEGQATYGLISAGRLKGSPLVRKSKSEDCPDGCYELFLGIQNKHRINTCPVWIHVGGLYQVLEKETNRTSDTTVRFYREPLNE